MRAEFYFRERPPSRFAQSFSRSRQTFVRTALRPSDNRRLCPSGVLEELTAFRKTCKSRALGKRSPPRHNIRLFTAAWRPKEALARTRPAASLFVDGAGRRCLHATGSACREETQQRAHRDSSRTRRRAVAERRVRAQKFRRALEYFQFLALLFFSLDPLTLR